MKKIKLLMALLIIVAFLTASFQSVTIYYGYTYLMSTNDYTEIKYSKSYTGSGDIFTTVYKLYHPTKGYHAITVTATHDKVNKKITVETEQAGGGIFAFMNKEEMTYENLTMNAIGYKGTGKVLIGDRCPSQLLVKFVSSKYENVKVCEVLGYHENNDAEYYILEK